MLVLQDPSFIRQEYLFWSVLDRSIVVVSLVVLGVGVATNEGILFMPYIGWVPLQVDLFSMAFGF